MENIRKLRIAFIVGTLGQGGAEKQLVYNARALQQSGVQLRIYCLTKDEYYETKLTDINLSVFFIGKFKNPLLRILKLIYDLRNFQPHIVYSTHFYTNLYSVIAAKMYRSMSIGSVRNDASSEVRSNGFWGLHLLRMPHGIIANSNRGKQNAISFGAKADRIFVLPNALDLAAFDTDYDSPNNLPISIIKNKKQVNAVAIGSLVLSKRFDRYLLALQKARLSFPNLQGFIVGDGLERRNLEQLAVQLGLLSDGVHFIGRINNIPAVLKQADILILSSDYEGMPNVILEAMAARLPVITTPAGDSDIAVEHNVTGYVVPFDDIDTLANFMVSLSTSPELQRKFGEAGRKRLEKNYGSDLLGERMIDIFSELAFNLKFIRVQKVISTSRSDVING